MKLLLLAAGAVAALTLFFYLPEKESAVVTQKPSAAPKVTQIFNPDELREMTWSFQADKVTLTKKGDQWIGLSAIDPWQSHRRAVFLSRLTLGPVSVPKPKGKVSFVTVKKTHEGVFDENGFAWMTEPYTGQGVLFTSEPEIKSALDEGIGGFRKHKIAPPSVSKGESKKDSLSDIKIAIDSRQPQEKRLPAIKNLRNDKSSQSVAALKEVLFEKTELDIYRYEAVDSLAAIGTKAAYKVILDRLKQVGRSGFELRMARALAAGMGRFFSSDEKTPESVRRPEVDELIKAADQNPPGK